MPVYCIQDKLIVGNELREHANIHLLQNDTYIVPSCKYVCMIQHEKSDFSELYNKMDAKYAIEIEKLISSYKLLNTKQPLVEMRVKLKDETAISRNPKRLSTSDLRQVEALIDGWMKAGIVRPSRSEFAVPIVVTSKKDGSIEMCVDFTALNKVIVKEYFPIHLIEDVLDRLAEARVFCSFDKKDIFYHVNVEDASRKYLTFVIPTGQFEFCKAPQELAVFQRFLSVINENFIRSR